MKIKPRKEFVLDEVLIQVRESLKLNEDGTISTQELMMYPEIKNLLLNVFIFPVSTSHLDLSRVISKAVNEYLVGSDYSSQYFLKVLEKTCTDGLKQREMEFTMLTSISLAQDSLAGLEVEVLDCKMNFQSNVPKELTGRQEVIKELGSQIINGEMPPGYTVATVSTRSRYPKEALERSLEALDIVRALINLEVNATSQLFGDAWQPANKVTYGKIHTLHQVNGEALASPIYFEPNFRNRIPLNISSDSIVKKNTLWRLDKISSLSFGNELCNALIRYARALDEPDNNVAVIKLWATFETLLIKQGEDRKNISHMLSALCSNSKLEFLFLENIRLYRNNHVHAGIQDDSPINYSYKLHTNFFRLLSYYLELKHKSLATANKDLFTAGSGEKLINDELENLKRVKHRFKGLL